MADNQATLAAINYHKSQLYDLLDMARTAGILTDDTDVVVVRKSDLEIVFDYASTSYVRLLEEYGDYDAMMRIHECIQHKEARCHSK